MNWLHGKIDDHVTFLGISFFWIGRIAKFLEFASGSVIVLDYIGLEALKDMDQRVTAYLGRIQSYLDGTTWPQRGVRLATQAIFFSKWPIRMWVWMVICCVACLDTPSIREFLSNHLSKAALDVSYYACVFIVVVLLVFPLARLAGAWLYRRINAVIKVLHNSEEDPRRPIVGIAFICLIFGFALDFITS